ncbi:MAG TPA: AI-2E family transporter [Amycolatopsis sp.]|uniref:AI-2E family transporter n=1 Tax=Amycolatopsis sp. TaxID=37632 RepID=UPI002B48D70A|nr:AI-2E family transporter [Amycolatopsis sp.]HKS44055.1 AI-2E family transporter [Amycolatopsis sp.]
MAGAEGEPIAAAEGEAARLSTRERPLGAPGRPMDRRSPFFVGPFGALGVGVAYGLFQVLVTANHVLVLIGLSAFLAIGLNPAVEWLIRRRFPRWAAVLVVLFAVLVVVGGFIAAAIPPLVSQATTFAGQLPRWWQDLQNHSSLLGRLNDRFHLQDRLTSLVSGDAGSLLQGVIGAGQIVLGAVASMVTVVVLTIYFLADMPRIRRTIYRMVPHSRRPRVILIGDEIFSRIGGYLLGNLITSLIAGLATFAWTEATGIPYPVLLSLFVAIMDLIPVVGSTIAGLVVTLVALTVSPPLALATGGYIIAYRVAEDHLLVPKIIDRTVRVPAVTTIVAFVVGGALLGVIGAFIAIPVAAVIGLLLNEVFFPKLDRG